MGSGNHEINPGGISDMFEDSGDSSCEIDNDLWTCALKRHNSCNEDAMYDAEGILSIFENVVTVNSDLPSVDSTALFCY